MARRSQLGLCMLLVASLLAVLVGISLGIMGGGGSILTVPILRYVLGMDAHHAIAVSMIVVSTTSLAALVPHARAGRVRFRVALGFGLAGMVGAFFAGRLTHHLPGIALLSGFALMMFATAFAMLRKGKPQAAAAEVSLPKILSLGAGVGAVTGLLGAGGGFVIVPALVLFAGLPMELAVGTSLVVVAMNAAAGFLGVMGQVSVDGTIALVISLSAVLGSIGGSFLSRRISPAALRQGFGWFVIAMAYFILAQELPGLFGRAPSIAIALLCSLSGSLLTALLWRLSHRHPEPARSSLPLPDAHEHVPVGK